MCFFLGLLVRLFVCLNTFIINPDGALYIHQARAMYYGEWEKLTTCYGMSYLSIYPIFVAGAYTIFHDWIVAAKSVSFFFGSITLIPAYLIFRRFFEDKISVLSTLAFSLIPVFVVGSADIIKGPIYWFFLTTGLYLFICQINSNRYRLSLVLSCLSFLLAASARIESVLFIIVSCLFLMVAKHERRIGKSVVFALPVILILVIVFFSSLFLGIPVKWSQICGVNVMVETALENFNIKPSQGTHFFNNITSRGIGYINVPYNSKENFIDWNWLNKQNKVKELKFAKHIQLKNPLSIRNFMLY